jgi:hypothetical protein
MLRPAHIVPLVLVALAAPVSADGAGTGSAPATQVAEGSSYQLTAQLGLPSAKKSARAASGVFTATVASAGTNGLLAWRLTFKGLNGPVLAAHIRLGAAGKTGPAAIRLCRPCQSGSHGSFPAASALLKAIVAGGTYTTIDTKRSPRGQIRGQVKAVQVASRTSAPSQTGVATLTSANASGAAGKAELSWDPGTNVLTVTVDVSGLAPGGNYTEQITPGCTAATGHLYKLDDFAADLQGNAHVSTQVPDVPAIDLSGAWAVKIGNPGTVPAGQGGGQPGQGGGGGGGGAQAAVLGQIACGLALVPGASLGAISTAPPVQPVTIWQAGSGPVIKAAQAAKLALAVVQRRGWTSLRIDEVNIFPDWFEVEFLDADGLAGPEIYVNGKSGNIGPEQGPNLGWDTVYGKAQCASELGEAPARQIAQNALASHEKAAGQTLGDSEHHHGYWEFKLERGGKVVNQVNVNECTQRVVFEDLWQPDVVGVYAPNG